MKTVPCEQCGDQTDGTYSEGGVKWWICSACWADLMLMEESPASPAITKQGDDTESEGTN